MVDNASTDDTMQVARRSRRACRVSPLCTCRARAVVTRCVRRGRPASPPSSRTWTSTSPPRCRPCSRWWPRSSPATVTSPSVAPGPGRAGRARPEAELISRGLQPAAEAHTAGPVQRRPVRLQGAAAARRPSSCSPRRGQPVVLRHRTPRDGRTARAAHRGGPGGLDGRSRFRVTSWRPRSTTCAACGGSSSTGQGRSPHPSTRSRPTSCCASPGWACSPPSATCSCSSRGVRSSAARGKRCGDGDRDALQHRRTPRAVPQRPTGRPDAAACTSCGRRCTPSASV